MQAGFTMLEAGTVSTRNTKNLLVKNVLDAATAGVVWWICGYGFALGESYNGLVGISSFLFNDVRDKVVSEQYFAAWFFHFTFCGAVKESIH